jgi:hypothetical protein
MRGQRVEQLLALGADLDPLISLQQHHAWQLSSSMASSKGEGSGMRSDPARPCVPATLTPPQTHPGPTLHMPLPHTHTLAALAEALLQARVGSEELGEGSRF